MYDDERDIEYVPLTCMNDEDIANRIRFEGAEERIFVISASQKMNSDIAINFRHYLVDKKIDLLVPFQEAQEEYLSQLQEYTNASTADDQIFFEAPFLETQALISETTELTYEKKDQTGVVVIKEQGNNRKAFAERQEGIHRKGLYESVPQKYLQGSRSDHGSPLFFLQGQG